MGGIVSTIFGGSKNKSSGSSSSQSTQSSSSTSSSESGNKAYDYLMGAMSPNVQMGNDAFSMIGNMMGVGGDPGAADAAYENYAKNSGFSRILDNAMTGIQNSAASRGMRLSGATLGAMQNKTGELVQNNLGNFMQQLSGLFSGGQQSAGLIGGAGGYSNSQSQSNSYGQSSSTGTQNSSGSSSPGIFGSLFPGGLSDRRLKEDLVPLGENPQGITVYRFKFTNLPGEHVGVMADEVAEVLPEAIGERYGYNTVNYEMLEPLAGHPFTEPVKELN